VNDPLYTYIFIHEDEGTPATISVRSSTLTDDPQVMLYLFAEYLFQAQGNESSWRHCDEDLRNSRDEILDELRNLFENEGAWPYRNVDEDLQVIELGPHWLEKEITK
jgi:hypothetical protein